MKDEIVPGSGVDPPSYRSQGKEVVGGSAGRETTAYHVSKPSQVIRRAEAGRFGGC
jgi:hypothetical protein